MKNRLIFFLWRRRTTVFTVGPVILLLLARPTITSWLAGLPLVVIGELVRFWAAGHLTKNSTVVTSGPFGHVRNPLYVGSFFIFCGLTIMVNRIIMVPVFLLIFIVFHIGAVLHEEKHLLDVFGSDFERYCKRVPRMIPRLRRIDQPGRFSMALAKINREPKSAVGTLVMVTLFALKLALSIIVKV